VAVGLAVNDGLWVAEGVALPVNDGVGELVLLPVGVAVDVGV